MRQNRFATTCFVGKSRLARRPWLSRGRTTRSRGPYPEARPRRPAPLTKYITGHVTTHHQIRKEATCLSRKQGPSERSFAVRPVRFKGPAVCDLCPRIVTNTACSTPDDIDFKWPRQKNHFWNDLFCFRETLDGIIVALNTDSSRAMDIGPNAAEDQTGALRAFNTVSVCSQNKVQLIGLGSGCPDAGSLDPRRARDFNTPATLFRRMFCPIEPAPFYRIPLSATRTWTKMTWRSIEKVFGTQTCKVTIECRNLHQIEWHLKRPNLTLMSMLF